MMTQDIYQKAVEFGSSTIYEASGLDTAVDRNIKAVWAGAAVAGLAYTVHCAPGDNLGIHIAMERAPKGSVLVVATNDHVAGCWGEVLTCMAQARGLAGLLIDGGVRDIAALRRRQFPVFSRGITVRGTIKDHVFSVGQDMAFGGVRVATGDLVVADEDGVVIVPAHAIENTMQNAEMRFNKEAEWMEKLTAGASTLELMNLTTWREKT